MTIILSRIISNRPYAQGMTKITLEHTDHLDTVHKLPAVVVKDFSTTVEQDNFIAESAAQLDNQLTEGEQQHYINEIAKGRNPFMPDGINPVLPKFNDDGALRTIVLVRFLSMDDPTGLTAAVPLLSILTDQELMFLLDIDQLSVDKIRTVALDVGNIAEGINNYVPPLGGV